SRGSRGACSSRGCDCPCPPGGEDLARGIIDEHPPRHLKEKRMEPAMTDIGQQVKDLSQERDSEDEILRWNLDALVSALRYSREVSHNIRPKGTLSQAPSRETLA